MFYSDFGGSLGLKCLALLEFASSGFVSST